MKLRIALVLGWTIKDTGDYKMALGWQKYLQRRDDVESVMVRHPMDPLRLGDVTADVAIHFQHWNPFISGQKNIFYLQNAWPVGMPLGDMSGRERPFGGTIEVFQHFRQRQWDGYIFLSEQLREACKADGPVIPFATDPELMTPQPPCEKFAHKVSFVGSNIRGDAANEQWLKPHVKDGLVIYGSGWEGTEFAPYWRGRLADEDLAKVFSNSIFNLDFRIPEHARYGVINQRCYEVLACNGHLYGESADEGRDREWVLAHGSYEQRVAVLMDYLKAIV